MLDERGVLRLVAVLLLVAAAHLIGLGVLPLAEPDEGRYADVARSLERDAAWYLPLANGTPFLDKPPLVPWLAAASEHLLGPGHFALRVVPVAFSLLAACAAALFARAVYGPGPAPALAALVYGTSPLGLLIGRSLTLDAPLAALVALGAYVHLRGSGAFGARWPRPRLAAATAGVLYGLATLIKGPVAIVLGGLAALAALLTCRADPAARRGLLSPLPYLVALAVAAPWYVLVLRAEPEFAEIFFWHENLARFAGIPGEHRHGPFFFAAVVVVGLGPWTLAVPGLATGRRERRPGRAVLLAFAALVVLFFSFSRTKVPTYVLPAFPAIAAVLAGELAGALRSGPRRVLGAAFTLVALAFALAPSFALALRAGWFSFREEAAVASEVVQPLLALLVLPPLALAVLAARRGRRGAALACLAAAFVAMAPGAVEPARAMLQAKSAEPIARTIEEVRRGRTVRVATYHYYYRGLPYYLDQPVVLLGEKGELKDAAFARRPELHYPALLLPLPGGQLWGEDCWTRGFLASGPSLVVVPEGQRRPERFLDACRRAGVRARFVRWVAEDLLFEVGP